MALAALVAALTVGAAQASAGDVVWGANDDAGKYEDGKGEFFGALTSVGLTQNVMTVRWDETKPTTIIDESFLRNSIAAANEAGVTVELDVYPLHSQALGRDPNAASQFAAWAATLAQTFPQVKQFVVMNECNQPLFVNPQFGGSSPGSPNVSAAVCGQALALAYDALKAVDPSIFVWGIGLSPRGNDRPEAASNISTSPLKSCTTSASGTARAAGRSRSWTGSTCTRTRSRSRCRSSRATTIRRTSRSRTCRASTRRSTRRSPVPRSRRSAPAA